MKYFFKTHKFPFGFSAINFKTGASSILIEATIETKLPHNDTGVNKIAWQVSLKIRYTRNRDKFYITEVFVDLTLKNT